ncbi:hypothetical protein [Cohnella sp. LGH]|uniref:hypothetical protein n=1 Tax=Cohnella sp. LGH TaxID=1619153 RepID=UPI001FFE1201|nr:hypothetical protein [Cohnella sp. LGH]
MNSLVETGEGLYETGKIFVTGDYERMKALTTDPEKKRREAEALIAEFNEMVVNGDSDSIFKYAGGLLLPALVTRGMGKAVPKVPKGPKDAIVKEVPDAAIKIDGMPPRVQSRINLRNGTAEEGAGFNHVLDRHFNPSKNASQFTITPDELKGILQSKEVVSTPVSRVLYSDIKLADGTIEKQARYVREVTLDSNIGIDKFSGSPTNIMTVLTDKYGNLVTATPGVIK